MDYFVKEKQTNIRRYTILAGSNMEDGDYLIIHEAQNPEIKIKLFNDQIEDLERIIDELINRK